jgi:hypothetical protein
MSTTSVKSHLADFHKSAQAIHSEHAGLTKDSGEDRAHSFHTAMAKLHGEKFQECSGAEKAAGSDDAKGGITVQTVTVGELEEIRGSLSKITSLLGGAIMPDQIRGVIPTNPNAVNAQAVTRPGQPDLVNKRDVPIEFQDLLKIDS